jgi:hypothetical protein
MTRPRTGGASEAEMGGDLFYAHAIFAAGILERGHNVIGEFAGAKNLDFPTHQGAIVFELVARQKAAHQFAVIAHFDDAKLWNVAANELRRNISSLNRRRRCLGQDSPLGDDESYARGAPDSSWNLTVAAGRSPITARKNGGATHA